MRFERLLPRSPLPRFFLLVALFYAVLMIVPWPGLERAYAAAFRAGCNTVFLRFWFWPDGAIRFRSLDRDAAETLAPGMKLRPGSEVQDTAMELSNRRTPGSLGYLRTSSRYIGYLPTAFFLSLLLATPLPPRQKFISLFWGLLLVHGFILFRLSLMLFRGYSGEKGYALFHPSTFWINFLDRAQAVIAHNPTVSYIVPTFIWFLVAFRLSKLTAVLGEQNR